jgi:uncharacterized membrane protein YqjE
VDIVSPKDKQSAIAAAAILAFVTFGLLAMPKIVIGLGDAVSPWLGVAVALLFILAPFGILWLRARSQRQQADKN